MAFRNVAKRLFKKKTVAIAVLVALAIVAVVVVMRKRKEGLSDWANARNKAAAEFSARLRSGADRRPMSADTNLAMEAGAKAAKCGGRGMENWYRHPVSAVTCCERKNGTGCPRCVDFYNNTTYNMDRNCKTDACILWKKNIANNNKAWKIVNSSWGGVDRYGEAWNKYNKYALGYIKTSDLHKKGYYPFYDTTQEHYETSALGDMDILKVGGSASGMYSQVAVFAPCP